MGVAKKVTKSTKAGLILPVGRFARYLKGQGYASRVSDRAPVALTAAVQYVVEEVLNQAAIEAELVKRGSITPRHIMLGIQKDASLEKFLGNIVITSAGVVPKIEAVLTEKKKKKKRARKVKEEEVPEKKRTKKTEEDTPKKKRTKKVDDDHN